MSVFAPAMSAFETLASALRTDAELRADVEQAFHLLLSRYSTKIFENRFIVGGVTERIIAAAFVALGEVCQNAGVVVTRTDVLVGNVRLSVKGSFQAQRRTIRLVNVMGDSTSAAWDEPTVFVLAGRGIGYADPELLPDSTVRRSDVIELSTAPLYRLWEARPDLFVETEIPTARENIEGSDIASRIIADEILRYTKRLKPFDPRTHLD